MAASLTEKFNFKINQAVLQTRTRFQEIRVVFKWTRYNFIKIVFDIPLPWYLEDNDVLNISDYVAKQIRDHEIIEETETKKYLKKRNQRPSCQTRLTDRTRILLQAPCNSYFNFGFYKSNSTKSHAFLRKMTLL